MQRRTAIPAAIIICLALGHAGRSVLQVRQLHEARETPASANAESQYARIVSLAPSITETLFALGLGDRVVGVTRYCDYPPEAAERTSVGGYYDPNYEAIAALRPDLVVLLTEHEKPREYLAELNVPTLTVDHGDLNAILSAIASIGEKCGAEEPAQKIVTDIRRRMEEIQVKTEGLDRPRVMVTVGRNMGTGSLKDVYISGREGFYHEMVNLAGGQNAYDGEIAFPVVSGEGIIQINPDVIIDMIADMKKEGWNEQDIIQEWSALPHVAAVKNRRVYVLGDDYVVIPGPRFILILEDMARAMHPEVEWG